MMQPGKITDIVLGVFSWVLALAINILMFTYAGENDGLGYLSIILSTILLPIIWAAATLFLLLTKVSSFKESCTSGRAGGLKCVNRSKRLNLCAA